MILTAVVAVACALPGTAHAAGVFVGAPSRNDVVYDDSRGLLYISAGDSVLRYDTVTGRYLRPFFVGGSLGGMDISPSGKTLAVADMSYTGNAWDYNQGGTNRFCLVDLDTGAVSSVYNTRTYGETGTWMVAYGIDGSLLVTSQFGGSGWVPLRRYFPITGLVTTVGSVRQNTALSASGDRTIIGYAEANTSDGPWGTYRIADGLLVPRSGYSAGTSTFNYEVGESRNGAQTAIALSGTCAVYSAALGRYDFSNPIGVKYSPTADVVYVPIAGTSHIAAYNTNDFTQVATYTVDSTFGTYQIGLTEAGSLAWPRLAISRDNSLLFCTVNGGVQCFRLRSAVKGTVYSSFGGSPLPGALVELYRQNGAAWSLAGTSTTGPSGSYTYVSDDASAPLRVRVSDPSGMHGSAWVGGSSVSSATDFLPSTAPTPTADATLSLASPASVHGTLRSSWQGRPVSGADVTLYQVTDTMTVVGTATTAPDGSYTIGGIGKSSFRLAFDDPSGAHLPQYYDGQLSLNAATQFDVTSSVTPSRDATLTFLPFRAQGAVHSAYRGVPIAHALVQVWSDKGAGPTPDATVTALSDGTWSYSADTSAPLWFRITDPTGIADSAWAGPDLGSAGTVPTRFGAIPSADATLTLAHPGSIAGTVRSSDKLRPLGGITVTLYQDVAGFPVADTTTTADDGTYRFDNLGATSFRIGYADNSAANDPVFYPNSATLANATPLRVSSPATVTADAVMPFVWYWVGGQVQSSFLNFGVPSAEVNVWRESGDTWVFDGATQADINGNWSYELDTNDPVRILMTDPSGLGGPSWYGGSTLASATDIVPLTRTPAAFTAVMPLTHPATITGTVHSSYQSRPVGGVNVYLFWYDASMFPRVLASTTTSADGTYSFGGIGRDSFYVGFDDPTGGHVAQWGGQTLSVSVPTTITYDTTLTEIPATVSGVVRSSFANPDADVSDLPVKNATVEIWRESGDAWSREATVATGADGSWSYTNPEDSPVKLHVLDPGGMHDPTWFGGSTMASATAVSPARGAIPSSDVRLQLTHPGSFSGVVRDATTGARMKGVDVSIVQPTDDMPLVAEGVTAADGTYSIGGVAQGDYLVIFGDSLINYETQYWNLADTPASGTVVPVYTPGVRVADALLKPIVTQLEFGPITIVGGISSPATGTPIRLSTDLADAEWGDPYVGATAYVQTSPDGVSWTTSPTVSVAGSRYGTYDATVTPVAGATTFYRFAVPGDEFLGQAFSDSVAVLPRQARVFFNQAKLVGPDGATPYPGEQTGVTAVLMDASGTIVPAASVTLQSSADGSSFADTGVSAIGDGFGTYSAGFSAGTSGEFYRLAWLTAQEGPVYSAAFKIAPRPNLGTWLRAGVGTLGSRLVTGPTPLAGTCYATLRIPQSQLGHSAVVQLEYSHDGQTWTPATTALAANTRTTDSAYSSSFSCSRTTELRWSYRTNDWSDGFTSDPFWMSPWATVTQPGVPKSIKAKRAFWVSGAATAHRIGQHTVTLLLQRQSASKWKNVGAYWAENYSVGPVTMGYRFKFSLAKGTYRVRAAAPADDDHGASPPTGYTAFKVR